MGSEKRYEIFLYLIILIISQTTSVKSVTMQNNNYYLNKDSLEINISIMEPNLDSFNFNWNGTNFSFFDYSLVLAMNFNNNSVLGENTTNVVDISQYENNGTINGATWSNDGKFGRALQFDGVDDYIDVGHRDSLDLFDGSKGTLLFWVNSNLSDWDGGGYPILVSKGTSHGWDSGSYHISAWGNALHFVINNGTNYNTIDYSYPYANVWHQLVMTWNGEIMKAYIDGISIGSIIQTVNATAGVSENLIIGKSLSKGFNGSIDELKIWNRALSTNEIRMHYQSEIRKYDAANWYFENKISWCPCGRDKFGHDVYPSVDPVGGGAGYSKTIKKSDANYIVNNRTELLFALSSAVSGNIVYINDSAQINLTTDHNIIIPAGITLASGRGNGSSEGGMIFFHNLNHADGVEDSPILFQAGGSGIRITGMRLQGNDNQTRNSAFDYTMGQGIYSEYDIQIDNNEISNWPDCAICLYQKSTSYIHHNYIHHNRRTGYGYGVVLAYGANSLIEANIFDWNRHSIAGDGRVNTSYTARYNLVFGNGNSHSFDMHGGIDRGDGTDLAGDFINIYSNTFFIVSNGNYSYPAIVIRGIPANGSWIYNNYFNYDSREYSINQINGFGNMSVFNNCYNGYSNNFINGTYTYYGWANDILGNSNSSEIITIKVGNRAPIFSLIPSNDSVFNENDIILIYIDVSDPDNNSLSYSIKIDDIQVSTSPNYEWKTSYNSSGYHKINVSTSDGTQTVIGSNTIYINDVYVRYDVDGNGIINIADIVMTAQHINEITVAPYPIYDVNMDGIVNILDFRIIAYHIEEST